MDWEQTAKVTFVFFFFSFRSGNVNVTLIEMSLRPDSGKGVCA